MYGLYALLSTMLAGHGLVRAVSTTAAAAATASGGVTPTAPGPGDVFREGGKCTFSWVPDPSGVWKQTDVELMTGDNFNMVFITTVASFDGTDPSLTTFNYTCPDVEPNSPIYFYQFSSPAAPGVLFWTTRFAIADGQGNVTPPTNSTQPNGQQIPWGTGRLTDPSQAKPEPSYLLSGGASATESASASPSASATSAASSSATESATVVSTTSGASTASTSATSSATNDPSTPSSSVGPSRIVTITSTASAGSAAPTDDSAAGSGNGNGNSGNGAGNGNGAFVVAASWVQATWALGLTAAVFAIAS
ncbi:hypothetical protein BD414DRAFT_478245 [Trametes punicea]|nr:hypothetical protein BD414DRAFT_478245 [Trametes punicea]